VKKSIWFFFMSFRRKPESSVFMALQTDWTPVFTGVTAEIHFFHRYCTLTPTLSHQGRGEAFIMELGMLPWVIAPR